MNMVPLAWDLQSSQNVKDAIKIVHCPLDSCPDIDVDNGWFISVHVELPFEQIVIDFSHGQRWNGPTVHSIVPCSLEDTVMCLVGRIQYPIGVAFPCNQYCVQIPFCATSSHITPIRVFVGLPPC